MRVGKQPEAFHLSVSVLNDTNQLLENRHGQGVLRKVTVDSRGQRTNKPVN